VQANVDAGMLLEEIDKGQVGILESLFEYVSKIAARLMGVNQEDEMKAFGHGTILLLNIIPCGVTIRIHEMRKIR
jgi:hypothetical protein